MAPPAGKRVKGVQVFRPFIYGTTARPFNDTDNPRPAGVPSDHTHSWQVFVKGVEDTDIFYWLRRVQFKFHESITNHLRTIDADSIIKENEALVNSKSSNKKLQRAFVVNETGWGEFEITIKLYYDGKSGEKPQTLYHHLRLHPYGRTEADKEAMRVGGEVIAWTYEEQVFNEPFEEFYKILTTGARDKGTPAPGTGGKGKGKGKSIYASIGTTEGDVKERSAMIPLNNRPGQPFSRETEAVELKRLREAEEKVHRMILELNKTVKAKEEELSSLKASNKAAAAAGSTA
ncbi:yeats family-domain-containing protein [Xylaria sp. CBS 124048]|nr:yeats family-domain-containing protein [Xylaria sp. CBS 124048]